LLHSAARESEERISTHVHRNDGPPAFLTAISSEFTKLYAASEHASKRYLVVFTSSPTSQTATSTTLVVVFGSEVVRAKEVGEALKLKLGVKGRGKGPRRIGKQIGVWRLTKEGEMVSKADSHLESNVVPNL
jgi:misacylated tRNA(Ala) deacylase